MEEDNNNDINILESKDIFTQNIGNVEKHIAEATKIR